MQPFDDKPKSNQSAPTPTALADRPEESSAGSAFPKRPRLARLRSGLEHLDVDHISDDLERRRSLLVRMIVAFVVFLIITAITSFALNLITVGDRIAFFFGLAGLLASYVLSRTRQLIMSTYLFLAVVLIAIIIRSADVNVSLPAVSFNYMAIVSCIIISGLIISETSPFVVAVIGIIAFSFIFAFRLGQTNDDHNVVYQTLIYGALLHLIIAIISWSSARMINRVQRQQVWQNRQLMNVNHQLEQNMAADANIAVAVSQLSTDLSVISHDQSDRVQGQAQSVAIVTSTLEELSATARQIAEVAESVFTATEQALRTAEAGGQSVGLSIDSIAALTAQVEAISTITNDLGSQSRRISEIVETITELAEETNLLALNATIEAAGAGEYGRRFAVVASEVQMLANRSRAASRDVQTILGQIRNLINTTLQATNEGLREARRMSEVAGQAGESIEQIIETVESTTFLARQINLTTQQQRSATDQAVDMIRQVADDSREAAVRAKQLLVASDRLSETAVSLRRE